jgi:hypothetical protein
VAGDVDATVLSRTGSLELDGVETARLNRAMELSLRRVGPRGCGSLTLLDFEALEVVTFGLPDAR